MKTSYFKLSYIYPLFFSSQRKEQLERIIFWIAIWAFIFHFLLIVLTKSGWVSTSLLGGPVTLNPLRAVYTPFSIILLYEIYLLIYYLPKSITIYLGKQYEVIALILIRRLFNNLAMLFENNHSFDSKEAWGLLFTLIGLLILLLLIFCFYRLRGKKDVSSLEYICRNRKEERFVATKKILALLLVAVFIILFINSLFELHDTISTVESIVYALKTINYTFFNVFFTALILTEVLLLLFTFSLSDQFSKVIRNSGFIISTILLKLSFGTEGLINIVIILVAVTFGVAILGIYKLFHQKLHQE